MASSLCGLSRIISTLQWGEHFDLCQLFKINGILIFYLILTVGFGRGWGGTILDLYCKEDHYHIQNLISRVLIYQYLLDVLVDLIMLPNLPFSFLSGCRSAECLPECTYLAVLSFSKGLFHRWDVNRWCRLVSVSTWYSGNSESITLFVPTHLTHNCFLHVKV